jgi:type IV fimbrial biogenesis protein FimT
MSRHGALFRIGRARRAGSGLTLVELMVVIVVVGVLALVAVPSVRDLVLMQRLRSINAQLVTDLQFARSEAVRRGERINLIFSSNTAQTCYVIYTTSGGANCNCLTGAGAACTLPGTTEVRTVSVRRALDVTVMAATGSTNAFAFSPITGSLVNIPSDSPGPPLERVEIDVRVDDARRLRTRVNQAGRPSVCAPGSASLGVPAC